MTTTTNKNYYCSQKFWFLSVSPEKQYVSACCSATHSKIDINWLEKNPGQLFNAPILQADRKLMLDNQPVSSCNDVCWIPENAGLPSRRTEMNSTTITHSNINSTPTVLNIILNSDCNLTCSYCNKQYSTAWLSDIYNNGPYIENETRSTLTSMDRIIMKLSRPEINSTARYQLLMSEILKYKDVGHILISGGEPFLYNDLPALVNNYNGQIDIFTGLGLANSRLTRLLQSLPLDRITIIISAENIDQLYEFNRYGNSYSTFLTNLQTIKISGVRYKFNSVLSNLTIFGFAQFLETIENLEVDLNLCIDPLYLSVNVLDDISKNTITNTNYGKFDEVIKASMIAEPTHEQHTNLKQYINEFSKRRNLNLDIFPKHFINWINE